MISKADIILIVSVLAVAGIFLLIRKNAGTGLTVSIEVDGECVKEMSLDKDTTYEVATEKGRNLVVVKDGNVSVTEADCPDKICVKHKEISKQGETIICLPHKLVVEVR